MQIHFLSRLLGVSSTLRSFNGGWRPRGIKVPQWFVTWGCCTLQLAKPDFRKKLGVCTWHRKSCILDCGSEMSWGRISFWLLPDWTRQVYQASLHVFWHFWKLAWGGTSFPKQVCYCQTFWNIASVPNLVPVYDRFWHMSSSRCIYCPNTKIIYRYICTYLLYIYILFTLKDKHIHIFIYQTYMKHIIHRTGISSVSCA